MPLSANLVPFARNSLSQVGGKVWMKIADAAEFSGLNGTSSSGRAPFVLLGPKLSSLVKYTTPASRSFEVRFKSPRALNWFPRLWLGLLIAAL
jgi:hypothetical protein